MCHVSKFFWWVIIFFFNSSDSDSVWHDQFWWIKLLLLLIDAIDSDSDWWYWFWWIVKRLADDLKHILGSETSRSGLMLLFSMFQHEVLNKRFVYVFLEGFLVALFPNLITLFHKLHSQSPRVSSKKKKKNQKNLVSRSTFYVWTSSVHSSARNLSFVWEECTKD